MFLKNVTLCPSFRDTLEHFKPRYSHEIVLIKKVYLANRFNLHIAFSCKTDVLGRLYFKEAENDVFSWEILVIY